MLSVISSSNRYNNYFKSYRVVNLCAVVCAIAAVIFGLSFINNLPSSLDFLNTGTLRYFSIGIFTLALIDTVILSRKRKNLRTIAISKEATSKDQPTKEEVYQSALSHEMGRNGVSVDLRKAFTLYEEAANLNHPRAKFRLAIFYSQGFGGIPKDNAKAVLLYTEADALGVADATINLGIHYLNGKGVEQNQKRAFELFQKASNQGDVLATCHLAKCYRLGAGVERNEDLGFNLLKKFIHEKTDFENPDIQNVCLFIGDFVNRPESISLLIKIAELGNSEALASLGLLYFEGIMVEKNPKKSFECCQQSSALGNRVGMFNLAYCYEIGFGVGENEAEAIKLYQKSAALGFDPAIEVLQKRGLAISS